MFKLDDDMNSDVHSGIENKMLIAPTPTLYETAMPIAEPVATVKKAPFDNTFSKAKEIGEVKSVGFKNSDFVGKGDYQDYYRISLNQKSNSLGVKLDNLDGEVTVHVYDGKRHKIDSILISPEDNENLVYDQLESGDYFVRIEAESTKTRTNYTLSLTNNQDANGVADFYDNSTVDQDNDLTSANQLGILNQESYLISGNVAVSSGDENVTSDPKDVFEFELASGKSVSFSLDSLMNADALQLFDRYGNEIALTISEDQKTATVDASWLDAGKYYLQVNENMAHIMIYPYSASYDYQIKVNLAEPNYGYNPVHALDNSNQTADNDFASANQITLNGTTDYQYVNFSGSLNNQENTTNPIDTTDVYKIDLAKDQRLYLNVTGLYSDAVKIFDSNFNEVKNINRNQDYPIVYDSMSSIDPYMPSPTPYSYLNTGNLSAGTYYIQLGSEYLDSSNAIQYQVGLSLNPATNYADNQANPSADNTLETANAIKFENNYATILGSLSNQKEIEDQTDFYSFTLDKSAVLNFTAGTVDLKAIHLFDSKGKELALNDISDENWDYLPDAVAGSEKMVSSDMRMAYLNRLQSKQLDAGTYYVQVDNKSDNGFYNGSDFLDYSVSIEQKVPLIYADNYKQVNADDSMTTANVVKFDDSNIAKFQGSLSYSRGYPNAQNDITDFYKVSVDHASSLSIQVDNVESIESIRLVDANGNDIALKQRADYFYPMPYIRTTDDQSISGTTLNFEAVNLEIGDYYLQIVDTKNHGVVSPYTDSTIYTVTMNRSDIANIQDNSKNPTADDDFAGANVVTLKPQEITDGNGVTKTTDDYMNAEFRGKLNYNDGSNGQTPDLTDFYKFDLKNTNNLSLSVSNVDFSSLHLYSSDGTEIQLNESMIMYAKAESGLLDSIPMNPMPVAMDEPTFTTDSIAIGSGEDAKIMPIMAPWYPNNSTHAYINNLAEGSYYLEIRYDQSIPKVKGYTETVDYAVSLYTNKVEDVVYEDNRTDILADNTIKGANQVAISNQTIALNGTVSYVAGYEDQGLKSDSADFYQIDLKANTDLTFSFVDQRNGVSTKGLYIYDANGKDITESIMLKPEYAGENWLQTDVLPKGTYYVEVRENGMHTRQYPYKSITDYQLQVTLGNAQAVEHKILDDNRYNPLNDNEIKGANTVLNLKSGENQIKGLLQTANGYKYQVTDNKDIYKLEISQGTTLKASFDTLNSGGLWLNNLHLLDATGEDITSKVSVQSLLPLNEIHTQELSAGTYYLEVEDSNNTYQPNNLSYYERPYTVDLTLDNFIPAKQEVVVEQRQAIGNQPILEISSMVMTNTPKLLNETASNSLLNSVIA